jgi:D-3-phosphoglycerate dehydrogenase
VILSPHSATFTDECASRMSIETTKNIIDFFENSIDKSMIVKI